MKRAEKEPDIVTRGGKPVSVILPIAEYRRLLQRLENAEDAADLIKARAKMPSFKPLETYLAERRKSGG